MYSFKVFIVKLDYSISFLILFRKPFMANLHNKALSCTVVFPTILSIHCTNKYITTALLRASRSIDSLNLTNVLIDFKIFLRIVPVGSETSSVLSWSILGTLSSSTHPFHPQISVSRNLNSMF